MARPSLKENQAYRSWCQNILSSEQGYVHKDWSGKIPIALIYPNRYATGMSNLGFQVMYQLLNAEHDVVCERVFVPEFQACERLGRSRAPLSLESQQPLDRFEVLAFSIPFENDYPNLLHLLASSGIPLEANRRHPPHPLVWVGGIAASLNPEPIASFIDLVAIGEGEDLLSELMQVYRQCRTHRLSKGECLESMSEIAGVYVPSLYTVRYDRRGRLSSFRPQGFAPARVVRRETKRFSETVPASWILTPSTEFESLFLVEIGRGCARGCRFCAAGHVLGPTRHRRLEDLLPILHAGLERRNRIGLVSSSVCDHPQLINIIEEILSKGGQVSLASIRLDALGDELVAAIKRSGQKTLSLAPEAGSQRLRDVIRKGISEEQILSAAERAVQAPIPRLRFYFMVGLPTETWDDVDAIVDLAKRTVHRALKTTQGKGLERLTLSISPFVPKPFTPFQWHPFLEFGQLKARIQHIRRSLRRERRIHVTYELPKWARIQALLARGDRRLGQVLVNIARGMSWKAALEEVNLNPGFYLYRAREDNELFPWDFLDHGCERRSLWRAYQEALSMGPTTNSNGA